MRINILWSAQRSGWILQDDCNKKFFFVKNGDMQEEVEWSEFSEEADSFPTSDEAVKFTQESLHMDIYHIAKVMYTIEQGLQGGTIMKVYIDNIYVGKHEVAKKHGQGSMKDLAIILRNEYGIDHGEPVKSI